MKTKYEKTKYEKRSWNIKNGNVKFRNLRSCTLKKGILIGTMMGLMLGLTACGKKDELVFGTEAEQTQSATDSLAFQELEQVEEQAEVHQTSEGISDLHAGSDLLELTGVNGETLIYVDICGAVKNPGVYQVTSGSRLFEVIELAGGLQENAASRYVNQARCVADGEQIVIFTQEEAEKALAEGELTAMSSSQPQILENPVPGAGRTNPADGTQTQTSAKINLNTATVQELTTLTGIGESKANLIIQYRQDNGGFSSTEEIMNIEGIGEKTYAKFAEDITVQ